jgi:hypothetical protein
MGQKLYLIKNDKYRLDMKTFDKEGLAIVEGRSKYNYRLSIKEKLSAAALEQYEGSVVGELVGFDLKSNLNFGMYLYVIEKIGITKQCVEELAYGFIEILPDVAAVPV